MASRQTTLASLDSEIKRLTNTLHSKHDLGYLALLQTYLDARNKLLEKENVLTTIIHDTQNTLNLYQQKLEFFLSEKIRVYAETKDVVYNVDRTVPPLQTIGDQIKMYESLVQRTKSDLEKYLKMSMSHVQAPSVPVSLPRVPTPSVPTPEEAIP